MLFSKIKGAQSIHPEMVLSPRVGSKMNNFRLGMLPFLGWFLGTIAHTKVP